MPKVTLAPSALTLEAPRKANLLRFLHDNQIPVGSACGGKGLCASCKVIVLNGQENLSRPNDRELDLAERNRLPKNERIACQLKVLGDIEITTSYWTEDLSNDERKEPDEISSNE
jgi:ferredoxin